MERMSPDAPTLAPVVARWLAALEARHLAHLRPRELARGVLALSAAYVDRAAQAPGRARLARALEGAGKRAAFALFYGPLHFFTVQRIVRTLGAADPALGLIVDLGCGTGVAGAAWSLESAGRPALLGVDRHPWVLGEAAWTYRTLGLRGRAVRGDLARFRVPRSAAAIVAAYALDELDAAARRAVFERLLAAAARGARVLVVEPVARPVVPEWDAWAAAVTAVGGRADEWRWRVELPAVLARLDRAARLDHRVLAARSLWVGPAARAARAP
jgi:hypothetical protein